MEDDEMDAKKYEINKSLKIQLKKLKDQHSDLEGETEKFKGINTAAKNQYIRLKVFIMILCQYAFFLCFFP